MRAKIRNGIIARTSDVDVATRFVQRQKSLLDVGGVNEQTKSNMSRMGMIQLLAILFSETHGLRKPTLLLDAVKRIKERRGLQPQTILVYLASFKKFVEYCSLHEEEVSTYLNLKVMTAAIDEVKKAFADAATRAYRVVANQMRSKVPSHDLINNRLRAVMKLLSRNLEEDNLSYKDQQALNFFVMQVRLNCRNGPILDLSWADCETIFQTDEPLETDKHKTGKYYLVSLYVHKDQRKFLLQQKLTFEKEYGISPFYVFSSSKNKIEKSFSKHLQEAFAKFFNENAEEVRYNANSIRKYWERRWLTLKKSAPEGVSKAHFAQTAHSEQTAEVNYLGRQGSKEDRLGLLKLYEKDLVEGPSDEDIDSNCEDSESTDNEEDSDFESWPMAIPHAKPRKEDVAERLLNKRPLQPSGDIRAAEPDEVQGTPAPKRPREADRASLNSTISPTVAVNKNRDAFIESLQSFRETGKATWTEEEKRCLHFFYHATSTPSLKDVKALIEENGLKLGSASYDRIYNKIKAAIGILRR